MDSYITPTSNVDNIDLENIVDQNKKQSETIQKPVVDYEEEFDLENEDDIVSSSSSDSNNDDDADSETETDEEDDEGIYESEIETENDESEIEYVDDPIEYIKEDDEEQTEKEEASKRKLDDDNASESGIKFIKLTTTINDGENEKKSKPFEFTINNKPGTNYYFEIRNIENVYYIDKK